MIMSNYRRILIKFGLWLATLILLCIVGITGVFADEVNVGYVTNKTQVLIEASNVQSQPVTLPQGVQNSYGNIYQMYFNISNIEIKSNYLYQLEIYTPGPKLININEIYINGNQTQVCQVIGLVGLNGDYPKLYFKCQSNANSIIASFGTTGTDVITSAQNWYWSYTYLRYYTDDNDIDLGPVISNQTQNTQNIINNNNQNTQDIINNQNSNNQAVIDNNNKNTDKIIENNQVCDTVDKNDKAYDGYLYDNGQIGTNLQNMIVTKYFLVDENTKITKLENTLTDAAYRICFYDNNYNNISCMPWQQYYNLDEIPVPNNASYVRFTINTVDNVPKFKICKNGNQALNDSINDLDSTLKDDSPVDMSSISDTAGWLPPGPIDSIINLPLNFYNSLLNALNGVCTPLNVPFPYINKIISIPCISTIFNKITGVPALWNWVGGITCVVILYKYLLALYKYYDDLTTLKANFISDFGGEP